LDEEIALNSQEALRKIAQGVARFQAEVYPAQRKIFEALKHHQAPIAMFFTCADSRILPNVLLQTGPGEIFTERTPGNIAPKYSEHVGGVTASVEYAMLVLHVPLMIVCGHTDCGVVKALAEPQQANGMPALQNWMRHSSESRDRLLREHPDVSGEEKLQFLTEYNVLTQLENLKTHPAVASRLLSRELELRGWIYDIGDGSVREADPESGKFEMLGREATTQRSDE
jgi:carbonic anhydrase